MPYLPDGILDRNMSDTPPKEGDLHTEAGLLRTMKEALATEREWRARLERELAQMQKMLDEAQDTAIRWFMAASPYATPGSLEQGLKKLREELIEECALICESRAGSQATAAFRILMSAADAIRQLKS